MHHVARLKVMRSTAKSSSALMVSEQAHARNDALYAGPCDVGHAYEPISAVSVAPTLHAHQTAHLRQHVDSRQGDAAA